MNVLILCAGFGTRLKPLTNYLPKALVPVLNKPVLEYHLEASLKLNPNKMFINTHHLAKAVEEYAKSRVDHIFHEDEILGTGGPLKRLYDEGFSDDLLVINCDIIHDINLASFVEESSKTDARFAIMGLDEPRINTLQVNAENRLEGVKDIYSTGKSDFSRTFAGIAWYRGRTLAEINDTSIVRFWKRQAEKGDIPFVYCPNEINWFDVGSPKGLHQANFFMLNKQRLNEVVASRNPGVTVMNSIIGRNAAIEPGSRLENTLVMDNVIRSHADQYKNEIVGKDFKWKIEAE